MGWKLIVVPDSEGAADDLSDQELVMMATCLPGDILARAWGRQIGRLQPGPCRLVEILGDEHRVGHRLAVGDQHRTLALDAHLDLAVPFGAQVALAGGEVDGDELGFGTAFEQGGEHGQRRPVRLAMIEGQAHACGSRSRIVTRLTMSVRPSAQVALTAGRS